MGSAHETKNIERQGQPPTIDLPAYATGAAHNARRCCLVSCWSSAVSLSTSVAVRCLRSPFKLLTDLRVLQKAAWGCGQRLHGASGGAFVDRGQEVIEPRQIGKSFTRPFQFHQRGADSGLSVSRLSAHACTA